MTAQVSHRELLEHIRSRTDDELDDLERDPRVQTLVWAHVRAEWLRRRDERRKAFRSMLCHFPDEYVARTQQPPRRWLVCMAPAVPSPPMRLNPAAQLPARTQQELCVCGVTMPRVLVAALRNALRGLPVGELLHD